MDREAFASAMRAFKTHTPFQPFTVVTVSGGRYEVDHPEALAIRGGSGVALFIAPGNVPVIFDHDGVSEFVGGLSNPQKKN